MALTPRIEIKPSQSLLMNNQLRQAISMLQLSNIELSEFLEKELEENPLLVREDEQLSQNDSKEQTIDDYKEELPSTDNNLDIDYDNQFDDFGSDRQDYDIGEHKTNNYDDDYDFFANQRSKEKSLYIFLDEQISQAFRSPKEKIIAQRLSQDLDEAGYFRGDINKIAQSLEVSKETIQKILKRMQGFEPSGIFATSLSQCLEIQLRDKNLLDPMMNILLQNLELLGSRNFKELKRLCDCSDEDLSTMLSDIKSLNPKPTKDYNNDITNYIIPDVFVRSNKYGEYWIELNSATLPRVLINQQYASLIKKDKSAKRYVKENLSKASFIIKALHQRADTILRVCEYLVKNQKDFLDYGIEYIKPLMLKEVAEAIDMHESTISRVTTNKYMHTPRGLFELKYFFSNKAGSYTGKEDISTLTIKHKIKKIVEDEDTKVLSDDKIAEILATEGIKIARRTITKYREELNILSSSERKKQKAFKL